MGSHMLNEEYQKNIHWSLVNKALIYYYYTININIILIIFYFQACRILSIPQILTEQYPKGLGPTVPELGAEGLKPHTKTSFSMLTESVESSLKSLGDPQQVILCGIEAQACIAVTSNVCLDWCHGTFLLSATPLSLDHDI